MLPVCRFTCRRYEGMGEVRKGILLLHKLLHQLFLLRCQSYQIHSFCKSSAVYVLGEVTAWAHP